MTVSGPCAISLVLSCLLCQTALDARAQGYPSRPVKIVVPFPPGGTNDIVGRIVAEKLALVLKRPVIIENHGGAGGVIGTDMVAKAPADGYTLLEGNAGALAMGLSLYPKMPYDVLQDFAPISMLADSTFVLAMHPSVPVKSVKELVAFARTHPGRLNAAVPGLATPPHLLSELFRHRTAIKITLVPYKGGGPAAIDLIAGQVDMAFVNLPSVLEFIKSRRLKAIAVANVQRSELLPEIPTMGEAGYAGIVASPWMALLAPSGTPKEIIARLNAEVVKIMSSPMMKEYLTKQGANPLWGTPDETLAFIRDEIGKWAKVVKEANVKLE